MLHDFFNSTQASSLSIYLMSLTTINYFMKIMQLLLKASITINQGFVLIIIWNVDKANVHGLHNNNNNNTMATSR